MQQIEVTRLFEETYKCDSPVIVHRGGARSSKSHSILQYLIYRMTNEARCQILITRKTMPALRITAYKIFIELLQEYGYYQYCDHSLTNNTLVYKPNNSFVAFISIDNPERIKSSEWNVIHMEEGNEFSHNDFIVLKTRLSAPTETHNNIILSINPTNACHWIRTKVMDRDDCQEIVSNYKDNPFLSKEYIKSLEDLIDIDKNFYKIYTLGEWGSLDHVIYNNWKEVDKFPIVDRTIYGCDFGFVSPTALVEIGLRKDGVYLRELLYRSGLTNSDLIEWCRNNLPKGAIVYCDSAEPARIQEMIKFNIQAYKSDKSIKDGIDFVRRQKLYILSSSTNIIKEIQAYTYKEDRNDQVMEEPVKFNDHTMDSIRYALYTHLGRASNYRLITGEGRESL